MHNYIINESRLVAKRDSINVATPTYFEQSYLQNGLANFNDVSMSYFIAIELYFELMYEV